MGSDNTARSALQTVWSHRSLTVARTYTQRRQEHQQHASCWQAHARTPAGTQRHRHPHAWSNTAHRTARAHLLVSSITRVLMACEGVMGRIASCGAQAPHGGTHVRNVHNWTHRMTQANRETDGDGQRQIMAVKQPAGAQTQDSTREGGEQPHLCAEVRPSTAAHNSKRQTDEDT